MNNLPGHLNLLKGLVKTQLEKYGDELVNLYQKVKRGGALTTSKEERQALYNLADKYQIMRGNTNPINAAEFTGLVNSIKENVALKQMVQWGGGTDGLKQKNTKPSKRLAPLYQDYLLNYKSSQFSTDGKFSGDTLSNLV